MSVQAIVQLIAKDFLSSVFKDGASAAENLTSRMEATRAAFERTSSAAKTSGSALDLVKANTERLTLANKNQEQSQERVLEATKRVNDAMGQVRAASLAGDLTALNKAQRDLAKASSDVERGFVQYAAASRVAETATREATQAQAALDTQSEEAASALRDLEAAAKADAAAVGRIAPATKTAAFDVTKFNEALGRAAGGARGLEAANSSMTGKLAAGLGSFKDLAERVSKVNPQMNSMVQNIGAAQVHLEAVSKGGLPAFASGVSIAVGATRLLVDVGTKAVAIIGEFAHTTRQASYDAQKLGTSIEEFTSLRAGLQGLGFDVNETSGAISKLGLKLKENIQTGGLNDDAFTRLGVSAFDAAGKTKPLLEVFGEIADRFKEMPDGARKASFATQLFEETGTKFIPVLNQGSEAFKRMIKDTSNTTRALTDMDAKLSKDVLQGWHKLTAPIDAAGNSLKRTALYWADFAINGSNKVIDGLENSVIAFGELFVSQEEHDKRMKKMGDEARAAAAATLGTASAERELSAEIMATADGWGVLTEAQRISFANLTNEGALRGKISEAEGKVTNDLANIFIQREADKRTAASRSVLFSLQQDENIRQSAERLSMSLANFDKLVTQGAIASKTQVLNKQIEAAVQIETVADRQAIALIDADMRVRKSGEDLAIARLTAAQTIEAGVIAVRQQIVNKSIEMETERAAASERADLAILEADASVQKAREQYDQLRLTGAQRLVLAIIEAESGLVTKREEYAKTMATREQAVAGAVIEARTAVAKKAIEIESAIATANDRTALAILTATDSVRVAQEEQINARLTLTQRMAVALIAAERDIETKREELATNELTRAERIKGVRVGMELEIQAARMSVEEIKEKLANRDLIRQEKLANISRNYWTKLYADVTNVGEATETTASASDRAAGAIVKASYATSEWAMQSARVADSMLDTMERAQSFQQAIQSAQGLINDQNSGFAANASRFGIDAPTLNPTDDPRSVIGGYTAAVEAARLAQTARDAEAARQRIANESAGLIAGSSPGAPRAAVATIGAGASGGGVSPADLNALANVISGAISRITFVLDGQTLRAVSRGHTQQDLVEGLIRVPNYSIGEG